ncbi:ammonium transporter AmtB-like domain-containing protein [Mycena vulgaris]|nr:ammonium transporter AmtB-like domain-containing protein [Mycena vulgaris]
MALFWVMIPGVGFFYSGLLRRKNALSMIWLSMMTVAVVSFQWFFWGFSLAFSETGNAYIRDLKYFALRNVLEKPSIGSTRVPSIVFCIHQLMLAAITCVFYFVSFFFVSSFLVSSFLRALGAMRSGAMRWGFRGVFGAWVRVCGRCGERRCAVRRRS